MAIRVGATPESANAAGVGMIAVMPARPQSWPVAVKAPDEIVEVEFRDSRPDARFPYGRGKAEFIGGGLVYSVLLVLSASMVLGGRRARPAFSRP